MSLLTTHWESRLFNLPGVISQLDFSILCYITLTSGTPAVSLSCFVRRQWRRSTANWLARTGWTSSWCLPHLLFVPPPLIPWKNAICFPQLSFSPAKDPQMPHLYLLEDHLLTQQLKRLCWAPCQLLTTSSPTIQEQRLHGYTWAGTCTQRQGICSNGVFPIIRLKGKWNSFYIRVLPPSRQKCFFF